VKLHVLASVAMPSVLPERCWQELGVWGDRSCSALPRVHHCHHCPVFAEGARRFLDRPLPEGYGHEHAALIATRAVEPERRDLSVVVFELGDELLCVDTRSVVEAVTPRSVHRVTRRTNAVFRGLVNIHGQLELSASLRGLFELGGEPEVSAQASRMLVLTFEGTRWVVDVDAIVGVSRHAASAVRPAPSAVPGATLQHVRKVIREGERNIGYLETSALFGALDRWLQ
jgi:chemotaxis-related protein WspD